MLRFRALRGGPAMSPLSASNRPVSVLPALDGPVIERGPRSERTYRTEPTVVG